MSETLREALRRAAESAPVPRLDGQLWRRGRRRRRVRRAVTALAALLLAAGAVVMPGLVPAGPGLAPASGPQPGTLGKPYPWQQAHDASPNGPVAAVFADPDTVHGDPVAVLVGQDGSYRLLPSDPAGSPGLVSPDGRRLAIGDMLVDLVTGRRVETLTGAVPLAWSPKGNRLLLAVDRPPGELAAHPDGTRGDPLRPDDLAVYDLDASSATVIHRADIEYVAGAFSADGDQLVVSFGDRLGEQTLIRLDHQGMRVELVVMLTAAQRLAGPAAWTPDGRSVMVTVTDGCGVTSCEKEPHMLRGWRMQSVGVETGTVTDLPYPGRPGMPRALVGWRDGRPVFVEGGLGTAPELVVAGPDGGRQVLLVGPPDATGLDVPRELVERGAFGAYAANPWQAPPWAYAGLAVCLLPPVVLVVVLRRRRRVLRALPGLRVGQGAGADDLRAEGGDAVA